MRVTLSAAVTADGYMDDDSPRRLIISTPGDWEEVYRLRAAHDAILAGAETLRRDDPSLLVRDQAARARRVQAGLKPDIAKVTLTRSGGLSPRLRFFTAGDADRYVFSPGEITGLQNVATVISTSEAITAKYIVTELEKRGIERLMPTRCGWPSTRGCGSAAGAGQGSTQRRPRASRTPARRSTAWR